MSRTFRSKIFGDELDSERDRKKWWKSPKWYKKIMNKRRRAKEHDALRHEKEPPTFRKSNDYNWS